MIDFFRKLFGQKKKEDECIYINMEIIKKYTKRYKVTDILERPFINYGNFMEIQINLLNELTGYGYRKTVCNAG